MFSGTYDPIEGNGIDDHAGKAKDERKPRGDILWISIFGKRHSAQRRLRPGRDVLHAFLVLVALLILLRLVRRGSLPP